MVKQVEITYEGGVKEVIQYTTRYAEHNGRILFGFHEKRTEVFLDRVLQIKELK